MLDTSESHSLPVPPQLLQEHLRDELDQFILEDQGPVVEAISSSNPASNKILGGLLRNIVSMAKTLLHREHKRDILLNLQLDQTAGAKLCEKHPQLRDIIQEACKEKTFSHIVDLRGSF